MAVELRAWGDALSGLQRDRYAGIRRKKAPVRHEQGLFVECVVWTAALGLLWSAPNESALTTQYEPLTLHHSSPLSYAGDGYVARFYALPFWPPRALLPR